MKYILVILCVVGLALAMNSTSYEFVSQVPDFNVQLPVVLVDAPVVGNISFANTSWITSFPQVTLSSNEAYTGDFWTRTLFLNSTYGGIYDTVIVEQEIPLLTNVSVVPFYRYDVDGTLLTIYVTNFSEFERISILGTNTAELEIQGEAIVGEPVVWTKRIPAKDKEALSVELPGQATDIVIKEIRANKTLLKSPMQTGAVQRSLDFPVDADIVEVEYTTPAPNQTQQNISENLKIVTVSSDLHYTNVLSFADIPESRPESVQVHWLKNGTRIAMGNLSFEDNNSNGMMDRVYWVAPHLSNQTFEVTINILTLQSFPIVGGGWQTDFTTTGTADLNITAVLGTQYGVDLDPVSLLCGSDEVNYTYTNHVFVSNYSCDQVSSWRVSVQTPGAHYQNFSFGNLSGLASNFATDINENISQVSAGIYNESLSTVVAIDLSTVEIRDDGYTIEPLEPTRLYVNETDLYKITYSCNVRQFSGNNRGIATGFIRADGSTELTASRSYCYHRETADIGDRCSVEGGLIANLTDGQYLEFMVGSDSGVNSIGSESDCFMNVMRVKNPSVQAVSNDVQLYDDLAEIRVNLTDTTFIEDGFSFNDNADTITVSNAAWYKIMYHTCILADPLNHRSTALIYAKNNGEKLPSEAYSYVRNTGTGDRSCQQGYLLYNLSANDAISLHLIKPGVRTSGEDSQTISGTTWIAMERLQTNDVLMVYDADGSATFATDTAIGFSESYQVGSRFSHTPGGSSITVSQTGRYEVSHTFSWDDEGGGRHIGCSYLQLDGVNVTSHQCEYSRGTAGENVWGTTSVTTYLDITSGSSLELLAYATGTISVLENASTLSIIPLGIENPDAPRIENQSVDDAIAGISEIVRFAVDVGDSNGVVNVTGTINGTNYSFTQGTGNEWYYDYTCSASGQYNLTEVLAFDLFRPPNSTLQIMDIGFECDATMPTITQALIQNFSVVNLETTVKVNASISDVEGNLDTVTLLVNPPGEAPFNTTPSVLGTEYFNDSINLSKGGEWIFIFFANDTAGNEINLTARELGGNNTIEVSALGDTDTPFFANATVSPNITGNNSVLRFSIDVSDATSGIDNANATINGVFVNLTQGSGIDWFYDWTCTFSDDNVSFEFVSANDTIGNTNSTNVSVSGECDVQAPQVSVAQINLSSTASFGAVVKINASVVDNESNLDSAYIAVNPQLDEEFNLSTTVLGSEYFNDTLVLNSSGRWVFTIFANDTLGQNTSVVAQDQLSNFYLDVSDPIPPEIFSVFPDGNASTVGTTFTVQANVSDNVNVSEVWASITAPNGTQELNLIFVGEGVYEANFTPLYEGFHEFNISVNDTSNNINFTLVNTTAAELATIDISLSAFNQTRYVVGWATSQSVLAEIKNTNDNNVTRVLIDSDTPTLSRIDVAVVNTTHFLALWADDLDNDMKLSMFDVNGNLIHGPTVVDATTGGAGTDRLEAEVTVYTDTLVLLGWSDDATNDYDAQRWNYDTWSAVGGQYTIDTNIGPNDVAVSRLGQAAISDDRIAHIFFDDSNDNITIKLSDASADIIGETDIIFTDSARSQTENVFLGNDLVGYVVFNDLTNEIIIGVDNYSGDVRSVVLAPTVIDADAGASNGVGITAVNVSGDSYMVVAWDDGTANELQATVYDISGAQVTAPFTISTIQSTNELFDIVGVDFHRNDEICRSRFLVAYENSSNDLVYQGYYYNGTLWDGNCNIFPELRLDSFNLSNATESENVTIGVNVSNSEAYGSNVLVELNISAIDVTQLLDTSLNQTVFVSGYDTTYVEFSWNANIGQYTLDAKVDANNTISELNELDNTLSKNYSVPMWHIYYGNLTSILFAFGSNGNMFEWDGQNVGGNIFYADVDANYVPWNLEALNETGDLAQLDTALNSTFYNDSIVSLFDRNDDGVADDTITVEVAGRILTGIPVANSTFSSAFLTGILWDGADGSSYTGSEDVVFFTIINSSQLGQFGTYDYEIRLPSPLSSLVGAVDEVSQINELR